LAVVALVVVEVVVVVLLAVAVVAVTVLVVAGDASVDVVQDDNTVVEISQVDEVMIDGACKSRPYLGLTGRERELTPFLCRGIAVVT